MENNFDYAAPSLKHLKEVPVQDGLRLLVLNKEGGKAVIDFTDILGLINELINSNKELKTSQETINTNINILGKLVEDYKKDIEAINNDVDLYISTTESTLRGNEDLKKEFQLLKLDFKNKSVSKNSAEIEQLNEGEIVYIDGNTFIMTNNGLKRIKYDV